MNVQTHRRHSRLGLAAIGVSIVAAVSAALVFGPVRGSTSSAATGDVELPDTRAAIDHFEHRLADRPASGADALVLGQLYLDLGREIGGDDAFARAEAHLAAAVEALPESPGAKAALGSAFGSRHRFAESTAIGEQLLADDPDSRDGLVLVGDAAMSVGDYDRAAATYGRLAQLGRNPQSLARAAHLAEVTGDLAGAVDLIDEALELAARTSYAGEPLAWLRWRFAELHLHQGQADPAREWFEASLEALPEFPLALNGLGAIAVGEGRWDDAADLFERSLARTSSVDALLGLAEVRAARGDDDAAEALEAEAIAAVTPPTEADRVRYDRDLAALLADLDVRIDEAVQRAAADVAVRPDVFGRDVYAWALYRAERFDEARVQADAALATGMQEPDFLWHSALIWEALGEPERAEADLAAARAIDPTFGETLAGGG